VAGTPPSDAIVFPTPLSPFGTPEQDPVEPVSPVGEVSAEAVDGNRKGRGLLYAAIVILALAAILTFVFLSRRGGQPEQETPAPAEKTPATQPQAAPGGAGATGTTGATGPATGTGTGPAAATGAPAAAVKPAPADATKPPLLSEAEMKAMVSHEVARREAEMRRTLEAQERRLRKELERTKAAAAKSAAADADAAPETVETSPPPV
jgi:hypothetical protein